MDNRNCENIQNQPNCGHRSSGLIVAVVLYILLAIILSSFRGC